jgi:hypothetical protein
LDWTAELFKQPLNSSGLLIQSFFIFGYTASSASPSIQLSSYFGRTATSIILPLGHDLRWGTINSTSFYSDCPFIYMRDS